MGTVADFSISLQVQKWIYVLRVITPFCKLYTAALAAAGWLEFRKRKRLRPDRWNVQLFVLAIEALCMVVVAAMTASGQFGPTQAPFVFHNLVADMLLAPGLITTIVVALFLHEKLNVVEAQTSRSPSV